MKPLSSKSRSGFTAIELLISITVIGVILAIALPAIHSARETARITQCRNNMKEIALAAHGFHDAFEKLPGEGHRFVQMLPYIEQKNLYDELSQYVGTLPGSDATLPTGSMPDALGFVTTYVCPSGPEDPARYELSYSANGGTLFNGVKLDDEGTVSDGMATKHFNVSEDGVRFRDVYDGTSNTVLFAERRPGKAGQTLYEGFASSPFTAGQAATAVNTASTTYQRTINEWNRWQILTKDYYFHVVSPGGRDGKLLSDGPRDSFDLRPARGYHTGTLVTSLADGSVKMFSDSVDTGVWQDLGSRDSTFSD